MTREEAIERLKSILETGVTDADVLLYTEDYEAFNMAIKELEKQSCEDCISRQTVLEKWKNTTPRGKAEFDQVIMMIPSVTPQPKIGEWLKNGELCKCSNCHSNVLFSAIKFYNYCYRCGADMRGEKNEDSD